MPPLPKQLWKKETPLSERFVRVERRRVCARTCVQASQGNKGRQMLYEVVSSWW